MSDHLDNVFSFNLFSLGLAALSISRRIDPETWYTITEAAQMAKCEYKSIFRAVRSKNLKAGGIGRTPRIRGSELIAWIEKGGRTGRKTKPKNL